MTDAQREIARTAMAALYRAPEPDILKPLLQRARVTDESRVRIEATARQLLTELRGAQARGWVNAFFQQYRLSSAEGIALLSLAEAFLRVPDAHTANLLVADKLNDADWRLRAGRSESALVNGATWGLVVGRAVTGAGDGTLRRLIARAGEPVIREAVGAAMRMMGQVFVMGRSIDEAAARMRRPEHRGFTASFDMLGEAARTAADAERYFEAYRAALGAVGRDPATGHSVSVKLSALHPRYEVAQASNCVPALIERLTMLARAAAEAGVALTVDAEESERLEMSLDIIGAVAGCRALADWDGLGMAVQAYGKRAVPVIAWAAALGRPLHVRLVKGAYWDSEVKRTQVEGLADHPLFTRKPATDVSYLAVARDMLDAANIRPAFATHNALTVATIIEWAGDRRDFEFQRLHGMGEGLYEDLVANRGYRARIYAPVGGHRDLLAYLVRRLLENGANSSFVHQLADEGFDEAVLLADPVAKVLAVGGSRHPAIALPGALFGTARRNSSGLDLNDAHVLAALAATVSAAAGATGRAPAASGDTGLAGVAAAVEGAQAAFAAWTAQPVDQRADIIERLGDLIEAEREPLIALLVEEAAKTLADALGEVREATDFCRYYAAEARRTLIPQTLAGPTGERNTLRLVGRGVWATIAPWNFPLAIFIGQCAAALVAGNSVVAKPAGQTPRIAAAAVALAHRAGVPAAALVLVTGGAAVGEALTRDRRIAGVAFTGSTGVAKAIARSLLVDPDPRRPRPIVPLIAETGGINAMIVDSTALPEQVVADIVTSAFRSAGQRCSALRLLLLQEDIAAPLLEMLGGAMDCLVVGDPADPATDIGPVIDRSAHDRLMTYRDAVRARWIKTITVPDRPGSWFVPPTLIRIDAVETLTCEWFGPLLHVATWRAGEIEDVVRRINALGYGLTMGLHSRIAGVADRVEALASVGNLYINRSMIGAVVGAQPFGGEGLSGTGPKAGGPHYLSRFVTERAVSVDTTSAGGNASLLSLDDGGL